VKITKISHDIEENDEDIKLKDQVDQIVKTHLLAKINKGSDD